jgi:hypothetical protein
MSRLAVRSALVAVFVLGAGLLAPGSALAYDGHNAQGQPCWATSGTVNGLYHATELGCVKDGSANPQPAPAPAPASRCGAVVDSSFFMHVYKTNVAGAAYTYDDLVNDQQLLITSPGAISGALAIYPDGTYEWTTRHSGYMTGSWVVDSSRPCGAITLLQGDSNEDWTVQSTDKADGSIFVSDRFGVTFTGAVLG